MKEKQGRQQPPAKEVRLRLVDGLSFRAATLGVTYDPERLQIADMRVGESDETRLCLIGTYLRDSACADESTNVGVRYFGEGVLAKAQAFLDKHKSVANLMKAAELYEGLKDTPKFKLDLANARNTAALVQGELDVALSAASVKVLRQDSFFNGRLGDSRFVVMADDPMFQGIPTIGLKAITVFGPEGQLFSLHQGRGDVGPIKSCVNGNYKERCVTFLTPVGYRKEEPYEAYLDDSIWPMWPDSGEPRRVFIWLRGEHFMLNPSKEQMDAAKRPKPKPVQQIEEGLKVNALADAGLSKNVLEQPVVAEVPDAIVDETAENADLQDAVSVEDEAEQVPTDAEATPGGEIVEDGEATEVIETEEEVPPVPANEEKAARAARRQRKVAKPKGRRAVGDDEEE